jgi:hypothetical protein
MLLMLKVATLNQAPLRPSQENHRVRCSDIQAAVGRCNQTEREKSLLASNRPEALCPMPHYPSFAERVLKRKLREPNNTP